MADGRNLEEVPLIGEVRDALDSGHPLDLLGLISMLMLATGAQRRRQPEEEAPGIEELVAAFIEWPAPETTALLTGLGEMLTEHAELRSRCRQAVTARGDSSPRWLAGLNHTTVHRAVRMTHLLGDGDELLMGIRFADGQEMTGVVFIDHSMTSAVGDAFFVPGRLVDVLAVATANNTDPDTTFADVDLADARAALQEALGNPLSMLPLRESDTWPACRALVQWVERLMPAGGSNQLNPKWPSVKASEFCDRFFASPAGAPFDSPAHRLLLMSCAGYGSGDPSRWSAVRLRRLLSATINGDETVPIEVQLDLPAMLHAFVPFAHAESGLREGLTREAVAAISESTDHYRAAVLREAPSGDVVDGGGA